VTVEAIFRWRPGAVPVGVPVAQVYGWLLDDAGRVLVQDVGGGFNLPGGSPERGDGGDVVATLRREAMEESQVTVVEAVLLGFEEVRRGGRPIALVRMVGRIGEFLPRRADPDGGRLFRRLMTSLDEAPSLLGWGESGTRQAVAAALVAEQRWDLPACSLRAFASYVD
jgi:8-oxo-dGTP pyrophosphatase MutT (NUDIX family)